MEKRNSDVSESAGGYLVAHVMEPLGISVPQLAEAIQVPANRLYQIIQGDRALSTDTAVRLGHYFGTGPELWLYLQLQEDLAGYAKQADVLLQRIQPYGGKFS
jgi:antitoxin HigA-1